MDFDRRSFLAMAAGFVADPERLLWRPGAKLISVPRVLPSLYHYSYSHGWNYDPDCQFLSSNGSCCGIADEAYVSHLRHDETTMIVADLFIKKIPRDTPEGFHRYQQFRLA